MKQILLALSCSLFATQAFAQITLDVANARTNPTGIDTLHNAQISGAPALNTGANVLWDFSTATYNTNLNFSPFSTVTTNPPATHGVMVNFDLSSGYPYTTQSLFSVTAAGMQAHGETITRQAFKLPSPGPNDSIIVNAQTISYSSAKKVIAYPATFNSTWSSDFTYNMAMTLNYPPFYNFAPSERKSHVKSSSSVVGWGRAKAKDLANKVSNEMSVLLVQTADTVTDSFFINGTPAPPQALTPLGLTQGQKTALFQRNLYRVNEVTPLVSITYTSGTYSTPQDINVHRQRLVPASVKDLNLDSKVKLYPNPVSGKEVTLEIADAKAGNWTYEITNITGQKVGAAQLNMQSGKATINLSQDAQPGIYFISLYLNGDLGAIKPLVVE